MHPQLACRKQGFRNKFWGILAAKWKHKDSSESSIYSCLDVAAIEDVWKPISTCLVFLIFKWSSSQGQPCSLSANKEDHWVWTPWQLLGFKVRAAQVIHKQFSLALTQTWKAKRGFAASTQSSGEWMISMELQLQYFDLPHLLVMKRCGMNDNQGCLYFSKMWKCFCPLSGEEIKQDSWGTFPGHLTLCYAYMPLI